MPPVTLAHIRRMPLRLDVLGGSWGADDARLTHRRQSQCPVRGRPLASPLLAGLSPALDRVRVRFVVGPPFGSGTRTPHLGTGRELRWRRGDAHLGGTVREMLSSLMERSRAPGPSMRARSRWEAP